MSPSPFYLPLTLRVWGDRDTHPAPGWRERPQCTECPSCGVSDCTRGQAGCARLTDILASGVLLTLSDPVPCSGLVSPLLLGWALPALVSWKLDCPDSALMSPGCLGRMVEAAVWMIPPREWANTDRRHEGTHIEGCLWCTVLGATESQAGSWSRQHLLRLSGSFPSATYKVSALCWGRVLLGPDTRCGRRHPHLQPRETEEAAVTCGQWTGAPWMTDTRGLPWGGDAHLSHKSWSGAGVVTGAQAQARCEGGVGFSRWEALRGARGGVRDGQGQSPWATRAGF